MKGQYYPMPTKLPFEDYLDSYVGERTIDIIKKWSKDKPFFVRTCIRFDKYKWWMNNSGETLFYLECDPFERNNLANDPQYKNVMKEMRMKLSDFYFTTQYNKAAGYRPRFTRLASMMSDIDSKQNGLYEVFKKIQSS